MRPSHSLFFGWIALALTQGEAWAVVCNVPSAKYTTIQSASDDINCTEIVVAAGTYTEQISTGRVGSIFIHGAGAGRTIIQSPAVRTPSTQPTTYYPNYTYIIEIKPGTAADIADLTIDGTGNSFCGEPLFAVRFNNATGSLDQVIVQNVRSPGADLGCQNTVSVAATADSGGTSSLTMTRSTVRNFQKVAVLINGTNAAGILQNNVIRGVGPTPYTAQNGIQFSRGGFGAAVQNVLTGLHYTGDTCIAGGSFASGIIDYQAGGPTSLSENQLIDVDSGITLQENTGSQTLFKNRVYISNVGIDSFSNDAGMINISANSVTGNTVSTAVNAATCFPESGDSIAVAREMGTTVIQNAMADSARDAIELLAGSQGIDVEQNMSVRSGRNDIEDAGTGNTFSLNACVQSTPTGLCTLSP